MTGDRQPSNMHCLTKLGAHLLAARRSPPQRATWNYRFVRALDTRKLWWASENRLLILIFNEWICLVWSRMYSEFRARQSVTFPTRIFQYLRNVSSRRIYQSRGNRFNIEKSTASNPSCSSEFLITYSTKVSFRIKPSNNRQSLSTISLQSSRYSPQQDTRA